MKSSAKNIVLKSVDDIFQTEENRADAQRERVQEIPLDQLKPFKNHPFKVRDDQRMLDTVDSIREYGVLVPAIARPDPEGGYELISGHRRKRGCEMAGLQTMPVIIRDLDDDAAVLVMVDSNIQREELLPSERAFAYKMKLEALKHQGARSDLTSSQLGTKLRADELLAQQAGESRNQVQRFIRLTELISELLDMLKSLQNHNERMLMLTFILVNAADTKRKLKADVQQCRSIAQTMNCSLVTLDFQQERAMQAALPLGVNPIRIERGLTTSALGIFIPFTTQELFQKSEGALYYGVNSLSHNMILVDRKLLSNPNGLILGTPGSGKSFAAKREMVNVFLVTDDDIIICDPEAEYAPLVRRLHGQIIRISPVGSDYINPLDINMNYADEEDPVTLKSDFVLSMCELIVGGKEGLQPIEKTVIDRCVRSVYQAYFADPKPETMPILEDLYVELKIQPEPEAQRIATALEIYVHGSLNLFNHRTNVNLKNRLVCYDIKGLGKQLKKLGMLIVQDQVWNRVTINRAQKKSTRYYMDEFHLLLKEPQTAAYSVEIWKRFRKWGGIPTAITQNLKDLLASAEIENIFENSDFILMLNQAPGDREILAKKLGISARQLSYVKQSGAGEGLLLYGDTILPFVDRFPQDTELYRLMTTRLNETAGQEEENG